MVLHHLLLQQAMICARFVCSRRYGEDGFDTLTYTAIALLRICSHHIIVQSSSNGVPDVDVSSGMSLVQVIKTVCAEVDVDNLAASIEWARKCVEAICCVHPNVSSQLA